MLLSGCFFAKRGFTPCGFSHIQSYLKCLILLIRKAEENGSLPKIQIAPFGLIMRFSCSHIGSNGIILSHLQAVVPYGGSVSTKSTEPSGMFFINSRQSPCHNVMPSTVCLLHKNRLKPLPKWCDTCIFKRSTNTCWK